MRTVSMSGSLRGNVGKKDAKSLRKEGKVPCVLYGGQEQIHFNEYRVGKGDTLWNISNYYSDENIDIRKFIYEIKKIMLIF